MHLTPEASSEGVTVKDRLTVAAHCLLALRELTRGTELSRVEFTLSDPETLVVTIALQPRDEFVIELYMESSDYPLDGAVTVFDHVQDHLAEERSTWGEARPACRPGHAHPASCRHRGDHLVLICPHDLGVIKRLV